MVFVIGRQVMVAIKEQKEAEEAKRRAAKRAAERGDAPVELPPRQVVREGARQQAGAGQGGQAAADQQRSEVEEFLRRIGQLQEEQREVPAGPEPEEEPEPPRRRGPIDPFEEPVRRPKRQPKRSTPEPQIELLIDPEQAAAEARASAQQQRRREAELRHLPESQLAEQAAHLGESISTADDRVEARLHKTFDHRLGSLGMRRNDAPSDHAPPEVAAAPNAASRIKRMLASPAGVRDAVLLGEILRRPDDPR